MPFVIHNTPFKLVVFFFFYYYAPHRDLHSFPTRRSSDLKRPTISDVRVSSLDPALRSGLACRVADFRALVLPRLPRQRRLRGHRDDGVGPELRRHHHHRRSEEHTSELQSPCNLVCRLLLE